MKHRRRRLFPRIRLFFLAALMSILYLIGNAVMTPPDPAPLPVLGATDTSAKDTEDSLDAAIGHAAPIYTALLLGKDAVGDNTDVMMLARFDIEQGALSLIQIPRDTYLYENGRGIKLGSLYARLTARAREAGKKDPNAHALGTLAAQIGTLFGTTVDYYLMTDIPTLEQTIDAIGGVTVDVPCDMEYSDPEQSLSISLKAGTRHLSGAQAVALIRYRSGYVTADIGRLQMQRLVLSSLFRQIKRPASFSSLLARLPSLLSLTKTNADLSDALYFLPRISALRTENITFTMLRGSALRDGDGVWYYVLCRDAAIADLAKLLGSDGTFDPDSRLTSPTDPLIDSAYRADPDSLPSSQQTADSLLTEGVDIPMLSPSS